MKKRPVLLGAGVLVALSVAYMAVHSGRAPSLAANIGKRPGSAEGGAQAPDPHAGGDPPSAVAERPEADDGLVLDPAPPAEPMLGDAHLEDVIDMKQARLIDDAFYITLPDGKRAVLTLDHALQEAAEDALAHARAPKAAIVLMSVDGRILALAGREHGRKSAPELATRVWAPAASVFKIVTSAALVEAGVRAHDKVCYHGGVRSVQASNLVDDARRDRQCNDLTFAMAHSQNAIIAKLAHKHLQPPRLREMASAFGIGDAPRFALPMDPGNADIPDNDLDFAKVAAGFWQTELSPLGGAILAATVASGGMSVTPRIVDHVQRGAESVAIEPVPDRRVLDQAVARELARMMVETTETGTARKGFRDPKGRKFLADVAVAGKTGTLSRRAPGEAYLQYSWFVGFAPADDPEYVISVLIGNSELWHLKAHTAARMVLQAAF